MARENNINGGGASDPAAEFKNQREDYGEFFKQKTEMDDFNELWGDYQPRKNDRPLPPPPDRSSLTLEAWINKPIPLRDYLLGGVMCTTSRWFVYGDTGVGKTLVFADLAAAVASCTTFLVWSGQRKARVMYLDGELPMETFKERMQLIARRYGSDIEFYGYNREAFGDDGMPPLNTSRGQDWLKREIEAIKPDLIIFDSLMCLLEGSLREDETWKPVLPFVFWLTSKRIAQVWLHHSNDIGKAYGDKTREWQMDTVISLSYVIGDDGEQEEGAIQLEFRKCRLRTPDNTEQFQPLVIKLVDQEWQIETATKKINGEKSGGQAAIIRAEFMNAYERLAHSVEPTTGFDGNPVRKVQIAEISTQLKSRGFLDTNDKGAVTPAARKMLSTAKSLLLASKRLIEQDGWIWKA